MWWSDRFYQLSSNFCFASILKNIWKNSSHTSDDLFRKAKVQYATSNVHLIQKPTDSQHTLPPGTKTEKLTMKTPKKNVKCKMWGSQKCRAKKWYWKMRFPLLSQRAVRAFSSSTFFNHVIWCWFSSPCIFLSRFSSSPPFDSVLQDSLPVPLAVTTVSD